MNFEHLIDRRKSPRCDIGISAAFNIERGDDAGDILNNRQIEVDTLNLSETGAALSSDRYLPKGTKVLIKFTVMEAENSGYIKFYNTLNVKGESISSLPIDNNKYRLGISFDKLAVKSRNKISNMINLSIKPKETIRAYRSSLVPS